MLVAARGSVQLCQLVLGVQGESCGSFDSPLGLIDRELQLLEGGREKGASVSSRW